MSTDSHASELSETPAEVLVRGDSGQGELVLRRRGDVLELIVDGVFAMDSAHPATEIALARLALARLASDPGGRTSPRWRVLVGGLGLGFTAATVLADPRVAELVVVELQPLLVEWAREGRIAPAAGLLADPRVAVTVGDVGTVVGGLPAGGLHALLLDVDNGPGFLVHEHNARLYRQDFLAAALRALAPGGVLAIWSADPAPDLLAALSALGGTDTTESNGTTATTGTTAGAEEVLFDVERDGRRFSYAVYLTRRRPGPTTAAG